MHRLVRIGLKGREGASAGLVRDVQVQVEFKPARVASYRLISYEHRPADKKAPHSDAVHVGDLGAGRTVTALYEIVPASEVAGTTKPGERLTVRLRYKSPEGEVGKKQEFPLVDRGASFEQADGEFRFAAAVAAWGMLLRDSPHKGSATFEQVIAWAEAGLGDDGGGHRAEFVQLVRRSAELSPVR